MISLFSCSSLATAPANFKESNTILLFKKGDPLRLENYRPICLANTIAKLYTSLITNCLAQYADHFDMLSYSQEGFRSKRSTDRQIQLVHNIIADAKLTKQDLYMMYVDFSAAFNTIDHDKLLVIMDKLGFPHECIHVIRDLYMDAHTRVLVAGGQTAPINIGRGTLQGDSLSPFLFIIFMEPLLRWLQSGGRGYQFGSIPGADPHTPKCSIGSNAYADDLATATHTPADLEKQAQKVDRFSAWAGLKVNNDKSGVSAILHGTAQRTKSHVLAPDMIRTAERQLQNVKIGGNSLPFLHPDKPYKYLGVMLTLTWNWTYQLQTLMKNIDIKGRNILSSFCSPAQKMQYIQSSIRPYITYSFCLGIYSPADLKRIDSKLIALVKKAYGLGQATPNNMVLQERDLMGLGLTSLMVDYAQRVGATLTRALNDNGPLGWSTWALLRHQHRQLAGMPVLTKDKTHPKLEAASKDLHILKKVSLLKDANIKITSPTPELQPYLDLHSNDMVELLRDAGYDPLGLGLRSEIPPKVYMPLLQLGVTRITQVLAGPYSAESTRQTVIPASALARLFPSHTVRAPHKRALNALALILNGSDFKYDAVGEARAIDLSLQQRTISNPATLGRIAELISHEPPASATTQRSVATYDMHEPEEYTFDPDDYTRRPGMVVDITHGKRRRVDTGSWRREALPEFEEIVDELLKRHEPTAPDSSTEPVAKKTRGKRSKRKRKASNKKAEVAETTVFHDLLANIPMLDSKEAYESYLREECTFPEMILASYDDFFEIEQVCNTRRVDQSTQYEISWKPHVMGASHAKILAESKCQYKCDRLEPLPADHEHRARGYDSMAYWENSWEPESAVTDHDNGRKKLESFLQNQERERTNTPPRAPRRKDGHLPNAKQQGYWPDKAERTINPLHLEPNLRDFIHIDPNNSINPDKDIEPSGVFQLRTAAHTYLVNIYGPDGKFQGTMLHERIKVLYTAYIHAQTTGLGPLTSTSPERDRIASFSEAVAQLLVRYKDGHSSGACKTTLKNHWATPDFYMRALLEGLGITTERFSSPLNFTPSMMHYYSLYEADRVFGANCNAFSCLWTGASQCNPEYEHHDMEKAVRWALISARDSNQPTLTAFVLPWWEDSAYFKWMQHPLVHQITRVKAKHFKFKKTDYATTGSLYAGNPKWDVNIFIVANQAGLEEYVNMPLLNKGMRVAPMSLVAHGRQGGT